MAKENIFYVGLRNPVELRRNVLEASRDVIELMKRYEHVMELKEKRVQKINHLKELSRDIARLSSKLKLVLPSVDEVAKSSEKEVRRVVKEMQPVDREEMRARTKISKAPAAKMVSEVKKLEKELMDIEQKLKKLSK